MSLVTRALIFAAAHHEEQRDRGGNPYIWHPIRVALFLQKKGYVETYQAVALLRTIRSASEDAIGKQVAPS